MAANESTKQPENGNNQNSRVYLTIQQGETWQRWHWGGLDGIVSRRGGVERSWHHVLTHLDRERPS